MTDMNSKQYSALLKTLLTALGLFLFFENMGFIPAGWFSEKNTEGTPTDDTSATDEVLATAVQKRASNSLQSTFQLTDTSAQEFQPPFSYGFHEKRALSNATQATLIEPIEVGRIPQQFPLFITLSDKYIFSSESGTRLQVIDKSNPTQLTVVGNYDTGAVLLQIKLANQYGVAAFYNKGTHILDFSNLPNINLTGTFPQRSISDCSLFVEIASNNKTIFIVTGDNYIANNFVVVDIDNPAQNLWAPIEYSWGGSITYTSRSDDHLFLTNSKLGLITVDAQKFFSPGQIDIPANAAGIAAFRNILIVLADDGVRFYNNTNSSAPNLLSTFPILQAIDVTVDGQNEIAYLAAGDQGFFIIGFSNPLAPNLLGFYNTTAAINVIVSEKIAYLVAGGYLKLINVTDPTTPSFITQPSIPSVFTVAVARNDQIYFAVTPGTSQEGLWSIDIANFASSITQAYYFPKAIAANPEVLCNIDSKGLQILSANTANQRIFTVLGTYPIPNATSVNLLGKFAYVTSSVGLHLFDLEQPSDPILIATYATPYPALRVAVTGKIATVVTESNIPGHRNIYTMPAPFFESRCLTNDSPLKVLAADDDDQVYAVDVKNIFHILNMKNPVLPQETGSYALSDTVVAMAKSNDIVYVAEQLSGAQAIDVFNPFAPQLAGEIPHNNSLVPVSLDVINNQYLYVGDLGTNALVTFNIPEKLVLVNNQVAITQGQTKNLTLNDIGARYTRQKGFYAAINFFASNVTGGQFQYSDNSNQAIFQFTQQDIINGRVQFRPTGITPPSWTLSANLGALTTTTSTPTVTFAKTYEIPEFVNNQIPVDQGSTITLTLSHINATVKNSGDVEFTVDNIKYARFQLKDKPGIFITKFSKEQIIQDMVEFVHLGGNLDIPSFQISAANGPMTTGLIDGIIDFNAAPDIINNKVTVSQGGKIVLSSENILVTDIDDQNLIIELRDMEHARLEFVPTATPFVNITNSSYQFPQRLIEEGAVTLIHDGSVLPPTWQLWVQDKRTLTGNQTATVNFDEATASDRTGIIAGVVVGSAALVVTVGLFAAAKSYINQRTRKAHVFADYIRSALGLQGVDNFETEKGKEYVAFIGDISTDDTVIYTLNQKGLYNDTISDDDKEKLANRFAKAANATIQSNPRCCGLSNSDITVEQLKHNLSIIVNHMLENKENDLDVGYQRFSSGDDTGIPLTSFGRSGPGEIA